MAEEIKKEKKESTPVETQDDNKAKNEAVEFSGKFTSAVGRRKRAVAQVRLYEGGKGAVMVNGQKASEYFPGEGYSIITQPLKATGHAHEFNFSVLVKGGGKTGQIEATRLGIARTILEIDPEAREVLKAEYFLTRDPRQVERKKPGLKKARKAPQWSKR